MPKSPEAAQSRLEREEEERKYAKPCTRCRFHYEQETFETMGTMCRPGQSYHWCIHYKLSRSLVDSRIVKELCETVRNDQERCGPKGRWWMKEFPTVKDPEPDPQPPRRVDWRWVGGALFGAGIAILGCAVARALGWLL